MGEIQKLYRAVTQVELDDIRAHAGQFRDSPHQSGEKGFFYDLDSAIQFAAIATKAYGAKHFIVSTEGDSEALLDSRAHDVACEGRGVYLLISRLHLLSPAIEVEL